MGNKIRPLIGISACLLGNPVRYNSSHCKEEWIMEELANFVDFFPLCPEQEMGLGTPREEIHLYYQNDKNDIRLRSKKTLIDLTDLAQKTYQELNASTNAKKLDGFILTRKSPSCGLDNVKTVKHDDPTQVVPREGLYAKNVMTHFPAIPKIDSGRIKNKELREQYITNLFAHFNFNNLEIKTSALQDFHKKYKYILMEHSSTNLKKLGLIAANSDNKEIDEVFVKYYELFFETLKILPTVKNRINTLTHIMGYFKTDLESFEKQEILSMFEEYRNDIISYNTVKRFFQYLMTKHKKDYLKEQILFYPYPKELKIQKYI